MLIWVIPEQAAQAEDYGMSPAAMPMVCAGGILVFSLGLMFKNLPHRWTTEGRTPVIGKKALIHTGLNLAIALTGLFIMELAGFYPGGVFLIAASMIAAGRRSPLWVGSFALGIPAVVMLVLRYGLSIYLP
jgi:hypothetical protein